MQLAGSCTAAAAVQVQLRKYYDYKTLWMPKRLEYATMAFVQSQ